MPPLRGVLDPPSIITVAATSRRSVRAVKLGPSFSWRRANNVQNNRICVWMPSISHRDSTRKITRTVRIFSFRINRTRAAGGGRGASFVNPLLNQPHTHAHTYREKSKRTLHEARNEITARTRHKPHARVCTCVRVCVCARPSQQGIGPTPRRLPFPEAEQGQGCPGASLVIYPHFKLTR